MALILGVSKFSCKFCSGFLGASSELCIIGLRALFVLRVRAPTWVWAVISGLHLHRFGLTTQMPVESAGLNLMATVTCLGEHPNISVYTALHQVLKEPWCRRKRFSVVLTCRLWAEKLLLQCCHLWFFFTNQKSTTGRKTNSKYTGNNRKKYSPSKKKHTPNLEVPVLGSLSFVDTPGVLSGDKQRMGRSYDFEGLGCNLQLLRLRHQCVLHIGLHVFLDSGSSNKG